MAASNGLIVASLTCRSAECVQEQMIRLITIKRLDVARAHGQTGQTGPERNAFAVDKSANISCLDWRANLESVETRGGPFPGCGLVDDRQEPTGPAVCLVFGLRPNLDFCRISTARAPSSFPHQKARELLSRPFPHLRRDLCACRPLKPPWHTTLSRSSSMKPAPTAPTPLDPLNPPTTSPSVLSQWISTISVVRVS